MGFMDLLNAGVTKLNEKGAEMQEYKVETEYWSDRDLASRIRYSSGLKKMAYMSAAKDRGMSMEDVKSYWR